MPEVVFYQDIRGGEPVVDYLSALERTGEYSVIASWRQRIELLETYGVQLRMPFARMIDRQERLYELRFGDHRCAFAEHGRSIVLLHAWRKQSQKLDVREAKRARLRLADWRERAET